MHTISIDHLDGVFSGSQAIYLKDKLLNITHDIKATAYSFTSASGAFADRFEIVYQHGVLETSENDYNGNSLLIYKDSEGKLRISTKGDLMSQAEVFDISGKLLVRKSAIDSDSVALTNIVTEKAVLLVKVTLQNGMVVNRKIVF